MTPTEREAWLAARMKYLTASDIGPVLGLSPHKTRTKVFREKVGIDPAADIDRLPVVMAGKFLEGCIFGWHKSHREFAGYLWEDRAEDVHPEWTIDAGLVRHPTAAHLAATPDGITVTREGREWLTEVKNVKHDKHTTDWAKTWRSGSSTNIPDNVVVHADRYLGIDPAKLRAPVYYWAQLQAQMSATGIPRGRVVVAFGGQARADLDYQLDVSFERHMIETTRRFWAEVVAARDLRGEE